MGTKITVGLAHVKAAITALKMEDDEAALYILEEIVAAGQDAEAALARARMSKAKAEASRKESAEAIAGMKRALAREEKAHKAAKLKSDIARLSPATLAKAKAKGLTPAQLIAKRKSTVRREGAL